MEKWMQECIIWNDIIVFNIWPQDICLCGCFLDRIVRTSFGLPVLFCQNLRYNKVKCFRRLKMEGWIWVFIIMAMILSVLALIKNDRGANHENKNHGLWILEQYIRFTTKYILDPLEKNKFEYKSCYYQFYLFAEPKLRDKMKEIDELAEKDQDAAFRELLVLEQSYSENYKMYRYNPKRKGRFDKPIIEVKINLPSARKN